MSNASEQDIKQMNEIVEKAMATDGGHALCPMCGGRARLDWTYSRDGLLALVPACITCGTEAPTVLPTTYRTSDEADQSVGPMSMEKFEALTAAAWEPWDGAWWRR